MEFTTLETQGLKRNYKVTIPQEAVEKTMKERLEEMGKNQKIPGFRPGKAPLSVLKQRFGSTAQKEVLEKCIFNAIEDLKKRENLIPALQPSVDLEDYKPNASIIFKVSMEIMPDIPVLDPKKLSFTMLTTPISDEMLQEKMVSIAERNGRQESITEDRGVQDKDIVSMDFQGYLKNGDILKDAKAKNFKVEVGSSTLIPGFEEQLVGHRKGENVKVSVVFPKDYHDKSLQGQEASFDVTIHDILKAVPAKLDDAFAQELGLENLEGFKNFVKERMEEQHKSMAFSVAKREILDTLSDTYTFEVPAGLVEQEFNMIWNQRQRELKKQGDLENNKEGEEEEKKQFKVIADRRIRLGLLLTKYGNDHKIAVADEELKKAMMNEAYNRGMSENEMVQFLKKNPQVIHQLRASLFEDKAVEHLIELGQKTEKSVDLKALESAFDKVLGQDEEDSA